MVSECLKYIGDRCEKEDLDVFAVGFALSMAIIRVMALAGYNVEQMIDDIEEAAYAEIEGTEH